jgi:hypothetical protein
MCRGSRNWSYTQTLGKMQKSDTQMRKIKLIYSVLFLVIFTSCSLLFDSYKSKIDGVYIPKNLMESIKEIDGFYNDSIKNEIIKMEENEFIGKYHMETGLWIRNNWNLWKGSRLSRFFKRHGIKHPDYMSGIILTSYYRQLKGQEIDFKGQIKAYKADMKESRAFEKLVELPRKSDHPEDSMQFSYRMAYYNRDKRSLIHFQTNSRTDSVWIYDYLYGWAKINQAMVKKLQDPVKYKKDSLMNEIF